MNCNEFNALNRGLRSIRETKNPGAKSGAGTDASAFHGRPGARVALLQSPILPAAITLYRKKRIVRGLPIDKPHTRVSGLKFPKARLWPKQQQRRKSKDPSASRQD